MIQLSGFIDSEDGGICKQKFLYRLKQSPRIQYNRFDSINIGHKYKKREYDHYMGFKKLHDWYFIYMLLYVDDMLVASTNEVEIANGKKNYFQGQGEAKKNLCIEIN